MKSCPLCGRSMVDDGCSNCGYGYVDDEDDVDCSKCSMYYLACDNHCKKPNHDGPYGKII